MYRSKKWKLSKARENAPGRTCWENACKKDEKKIEGKESKGKEWLERIGWPVAVCKRRIKAGRGIMDGVSDDGYPN